MQEALFWEGLEGKAVRCTLCRFHCRIGAGHRGRCGVRENVDGRLNTLVYGLAVAANVDPIEKKPFFHVAPGSRAFSIATVGCNFRCRHCQNYGISQSPHESGRIVGDPLPPREVVAQALAAGCGSVAYTYTEPTIFYEYALDTAQLAREAGLLNLFVSNGYIERAPLERIAPLLDAANIDLKGFNPTVHRELTGAELSGVLDGLRDYRRLGIWLEVTTLVIPTINDSDAELQAIARFIRDELGAATPWHVSAFFPTYQLLDKPPTPPATVLRARDIGLAAGLQHVYSGNLPGSDGESTACSGCGRIVIARHGYHLGAMALKEGKCRACGTQLAGIKLA